MTKQEIEKEAKRLYAIGRRVAVRLDGEKWHCKWDEGRENGREAWRAVARDVLRKRGAK